MSPTDIETYCRQKYNAVGDTFFPEGEIFNMIYQAQMIIARKTWCIQAIYSTTTVANQQDYQYPTNTLAIKRITYNGKKLSPITHRQDDGVTYQNSASQQSGTPSYYTDFNYTVSLRPLPDDAQKLKIYSFNLPQPVTATSTLDVPVVYHMDLCDYVLMEMFAQDKNAPMATFHQNKWEQHVRDAISTEKRRKRADSFVNVQDEDNLPVTILGAV